MDKYDIFLETLIGKSRDGSIKWNVAPAQEIKNLVRKGTLIEEAFLCLFENFPETWIFLINKLIEPTGSWGDEEPEPHYDPEIIIVRQGIKIFSLDDNLVDRGRVYDLLDFVRLENADVKDFFKSFDNN